MNPARVRCRDQSFKAAGQWSLTNEGGEQELLGLVGFPLATVSPGGQPDPGGPSTRENSVFGLLRAPEAGTAQSLNDTY